MSLSITVSGYNRPEYFERTLQALSRCDGVGKCKVICVIDKCDEPGVTEAHRQLATKYGFGVAILPERLGCNAMIHRSFLVGFVSFAAEFHVHLEDDTVPTRDCLRWFEFARDRYRADAGVMNVSGYQRASNGRLDECGARRWFTPWGWGTWVDRWMGLSRAWVRDDETEQGTSWDVVVNHGLRAGRREVFPTVSRIQNIGAEKGVHVPNAEWHAANHHVPVTADDIKGEPVSEWKHVIEAGRADHA